MLISQVYSTSDINVSSHITKIVSKATGLVGMLCRVLRDADTKPNLVAFNTLIHPFLEYGCLVLDPFLHKDIKILQKVRNNAFGFELKID